MPCRTITTIRVNFTQAHLPRLAKALADAGWQVAVNTETFVSAYKGGATFALSKGASQAVVSTTRYSMTSDAVTAEVTRAYGTQTVKDLSAKHGWQLKQTEKTGAMIFGRKG
jgi:hypothetical protein